MLYMEYLYYMCQVSYNTVQGKCENRYHMSHIHYMFPMASFNTSLEGNVSMA